MGSWGQGRILPGRVEPGMAERTISGQKLDKNQREEPWGDQTEIFRGGDTL